ncbi:MAG: flavodoxin family protein [Desulfobacteraceae bacterium]|nr:flavodoxin family protein [Desulfobacteraceae bacterium]
MQPQVMGISGSPVKNSNTDRMVKHILASTGLESEFVKLSDINVRPCRACKQCVSDNLCKQKDDFPALAQKIKAAGAIVVGSYCPYSSVDGFTKAFLERLWCLRHVNNFVRGKLAVTVVTGLAPMITGKVSEMLAMEMTMDRMNLLGQLAIKGNVPCLSCGKGDECEMSAVPLLFGENATATTDKCIAVEDQKEVWEKARALGLEIGSRLGIS